MMMKAFLLPVLLQVVGFAVIVAEIFIPSMGVLSAIALGIFVYSLHMVFTTISFHAGIIMTCVDIVLIPVLVVVGMKMLARSPLALRRELSRLSGVVSQDAGLDALIAKDGVAVTDLRPSGTVLISSMRLDVVTDGEYIESGTPVVVIAVTGNRIVVEKIK